MHATDGLFENFGRILNYRVQNFTKNIDISLVNCALYNGKG